MPGLFQLMKAEISIYPLTATETQLDFSGLYEPPLNCGFRTLALWKKIEDELGPAVSAQPKR